MTKPIIMAFTGIVLISIPVLSQTLQIYNDATPSLKAEYVNGGSLSVSSSDAFEGSKCLDVSYTCPTKAALRSTAAAYADWIPAKAYKYFQFACKASTPDNISAASLDFWCIHCDPNGGGDMYYNDADTFKLSTSWQVISMPMSRWAGNPLDKISFIMFYLAGKSGTSANGHLYLDDIKFTNDEPPVKVKPAEPHAAYRQMVFPETGDITIAAYSLNGVLVSSRMVEVAPNTAYKTSRIGTQGLPAGVYIIRTCAQNGITMSTLGADRLVVVRK
jgi:hypothetical protein